MIEMKDGKKILTTPITDEDLADIHVGDIIYLNGSMTTCRDVAHRRLVEEGRELPVDVRNAAIFHAGPIIRPLENDKFEMVSIGPTTSMRMEKFEKEFVEKTGVKIIIGKGGSMLKKIGTVARREIENMMDTKVNLQLWVKVRKEWRDSELYMKNYGYDQKDV